MEGKGERGRKGTKQINRKRGEGRDKTGQRDGKEGMGRKGQRRKGKGRMVQCNSPVNLPRLHIFRCN